MSRYNRYLASGHKIVLPLIEPPTRMLVPSFDLINKYLPLYYHVIFVCLYLRKILSFLRCRVKYYSFQNFEHLTQLLSVKQLPYSLLTLCLNSSSFFFYSPLLKIVNLPRSKNYSLYFPGDVFGGVKENGTSVRNVTTADRPWR